MTFREFMKENDYLNWIAEHEDQIEEIGKAGYEVGLQYFELNSYKEKIMDFLKSIQ